MQRVALLMLAFLVSAASAPPARADTRPDADAFREEAALQYRRILASVASKGKLDDDLALLDRVRRIASGLVVMAGKLRPDTSKWRWELHVTSDPSVSAFCMAGGKLLIGDSMVGQLELTDAEVAMLLGHEVAHALADHRRERSRAPMDSDPAEETRLAAVAVMQEDEADRIGMDLAHRAGWPASSLASFFDKLAARESAGTRNSTHASAASRAAAAHALARKLDAAQ